MSSAGVAMSLPHAAVTDAAEVKAIEEQIKEKEKAYKKETKAKKKGRTRESQRLQSEIDNLRAQIDGDEGIGEREARRRVEAMSLTHRRDASAEFARATGGTDGSGGLWSRLSGRERLSVLRDPEGAAAAPLPGRGLVPRPRGRRLRAVPGQARRDRGAVAVQRTAPLGRCEAVGGAALPLGLQDGFAGRPRLRSPRA